MAGLSLDDINIEELYDWDEQSTSIQTTEVTEGKSHMLNILQCLSIPHLRTSRRMEAVIYPDS